MKALIFLLASLGLTFSLSSCAKNDHSPKGQPTQPKSEIVIEEPGDDVPIKNVYSQSEFDSDVAALNAREVALREVGYVFKMVETISPNGETTIQWIWDEDALANSDADTEKRLEALNGYFSALYTILQKYVNPFALKQEDGTLVRARLDQELVVNLALRSQLVAKTVAELSGMEFPDGTEHETPVPEEAQPQPTAPAPQEKPSKPSTVPVPPLPTRKPTPAPTVKPSKSGTPAARPASKGKPIENKGSNKKEPQKKPANPNAPKATKLMSSKTTCAEYMAPIVKRGNYNCRVVGRYGSMNINVQTGMRVVTQRGRVWNHRGQRGVETKYTMKLAQYDVSLFTLNLAPLAAQSAREDQVRSTETCSANGVKISTQIKPPGGRWGAPEVTEVKPSKAGGLIILVNKPNLNLRLNCR